MSKRVFNQPQAFKQICACRNVKVIENSKLSIGMYDKTVYRKVKHFCVYIETTWTFLYIFGFLLCLNPLLWISKIDRKKAQQFKLKKICVTRAITKCEKKKNKTK